MKLIRTLLAILAIAAVASPALAQSPLIVSFTGGSGPFGSFYGTLAANGGDVVGYRFTPSDPISITSLGVLDDPSGDGVLDSAHEVGIWRNSDQALLASASVDSSGSLVSGFYYESITPVNLNAGEGYTIGAMYNAEDSDSYWSTPSTLTTSPEIMGTNGVFPDAGDLGFVYPGSDSTNLARIGPNALFRVIPEPASGLLFGLGALVLGMRIRRK